VRVPKDLTAAFTGAAYVYHLAAIISIQKKISPDLRTVNIGGVRNVVNACVRCGVKRLVHTGSVHAVNFDNNKDVLTEPVDRYWPEKVRGRYAETKAEGCNVVLQAVRDHGLDAVIALPSGVTGAYEYKPSNFGQIIRDVANRTLFAYMAGEYDFVDAGDVAWALAELAVKGVRGESYFIAGHKIKVRELVRATAKVAGVKPPKFCAPLWLARMIAPAAEKRALKRGRLPTFTPYSIKVLHENCNFSCEKLKTLTGYSPRPLEGSLRAQVEFLRGE